MPDLPTYLYCVLETEKTTPDYEKHICLMRMVMLLVCNLHSIKSGLTLILHKYLQSA